MTSMTFHLLGSGQAEKIENVLAFTGEDFTGFFSLLPGCERFMTCLVSGLAWFRCRSEQGTETRGYVAAPGAVFYCVENQAYLCARTFIHGGNRDEIAGQLDRQLREEEEKIGQVKRSLHRLDEEVLKRLLDLGPGERE